MKRSYRYSGPMGSVTSKRDGEVVLVPGSTVVLDDASAWVRRLAARGYLAAADKVAGYRAVDPTPRAAKKRKGRPDPEQAEPSESPATDELPNGPVTL